MDFLGLGYNSDAHDPENPAATTSDSDDSSEDTEASLTSAELRAREAEARLKDYGETTEVASSALPFSAHSIFSEVTGPPAFLDPEATRPLATSATHGLAPPPVPSSSDPQQQGRGKQAPGKDFDIASLAPPMKGEKRQHNSLNLPQGSVIEAKAKRTKQADVIGPQYTAAQIAMMGGNVDERDTSSAPQEVSEFLSKGVGGALLPRKQQDRRDKEKKKRELGQSSIGTWKSEAEMALRQQYD